MTQNRAVSRLGEALREARTALGLTQAEVAERAGVGERTVWQSEGGAGRLDSALAVVEALGMEIGGRGLPPGPNLGGRLAALRVRREMSVRAVSAAAGMSATTVAAVEAGAPGAHLGVVERLATALGVILRLTPSHEPAGYWDATATSSAHGGWTTPRWLADTLAGAAGPRGRFDLDPCSPVVDGRAAPIRARRFLVEGGLEAPWEGVVYLNPPFSDVAAWTAKARDEAKGGRAVVVGLLPARVGTGWWHDNVANSAAVWFLRGRLKFGDGAAPAPFDCAVTLWGGDMALAQRITAALPTAWHVPSVMAS